MINVIGLIYEDGINKELEDAYVSDTKNNRFAVIDGESGFDLFSGAEAAHIVRRFLLDKTYENDSLDHILRAANMEMRRTKKGRMLWDDFADIKKHTRNCCSVAAVQIRDDQLHYIQTGNCMIFVQYENGTIRSITYDHKAKMQEKYIRKWKGTFNTLKKTLRLNYSEKKLDQCYENARTLIQPFHMQYRESVNTYKGYGTIDGSRESSDFWDKGSIPLMDMKKIALVTDGLQLLSHKPPGYERWMDTAKHIFNRGLKSACSKNIIMEKNDPYCLQYPRVERSDDKTGILLEVLRS